MTGVMAPDSLPRDRIGPSLPLPMEERAHCQPGALTDAYGLSVQALLVAFAFTTLVGKRFLEPDATRRPWLIWFFDVSKQGFGAMVIHVLNIFLSDLFAGDPCTYYVVSYLLDCTFGLVFIWLCFKILALVVEWKQWQTLRFGDYGSPKPRCRFWYHQCAAFVIVSVLEKTCVVVIIQFEFWRNVRRLILKPVEWLHMPKLEVTLVVLLIPLAMNTVIFWVVDNITKKKQAPSVSLTPFCDGTTAHDGAGGDLRAKLAPSSSGGGFSPENKDDVGRRLAPGQDGGFFGVGSVRKAQRRVLNHADDGDEADKPLLLFDDDDGIVGTAASRIN